MFARAEELAQAVRDVSHSDVCEQKLHRILRALCLSQKLLRKFTSPLQVGAQEIQGPQAKQSGNKLRGIAQSFTKLLRASIDSLDFRCGPAFDDRYSGAKGQLEEQLLLIALWAVGKLLQQIYRKS